MASFPKDYVCGLLEWRAANNQPLKHAKLDEMGLKIAGCQHRLALCAMNMYQGELYGYAHYILQYKMQPANVNFVWVDFICKYWKWARNAGLLKECYIKPALSVMHTMAHNWTCHILLHRLERANTKFS